MTSTQDIRSQLRQRLITELDRRRTDAGNLAQSRLDCTASLMEFHRQAWPQMDPAPYSSNWHLEAIAEHLEAVTRGEIPRLLINIPPRCSKSLMVAVSWPSWTWAQARDPEFPLCGPQVQFLFASYSQTLSMRDSLKMRRMIHSRWYQERWGKTVSIREDKDTERKFESTMGGFRLATSVGGTLTGEGSDILVCVAEGEAISTPNGLKKIEDIISGDEVFAFDHKRGKVVKSVVTQTRTTAKDALYEIRTSAGFSFRCSSDHPVYVEGRGYIRADRVGPRDRVIVLDWPGYERSFLMREMRPSSAKEFIRRPQAIEKEGHNGLLFNRLSQFVRQRSFRQALLRLWRTHTPSWDSVLLQDLFAQEAGYAPHSPAYRMSSMRRVGSQAVLSPNLLFTRLRGRSSFRKNDWLWQFSVSGGSQKGSSGETLAAPYLRAGRELLRSLRARLGNRGDGSRSARESASPSHGRGTEQQQSFEPDNALQFLPQEAPSWHFDNVERITVHRGAEYRVYDLTVAGCHNFFAGGVLVHNCDDVLNATDANYVNARDSANSWWSEAMSTRLNNQTWGAKVVVMQRLHQEDLAGYLMDREGDEWCQLIIPMEYDGDWRPQTWLGWKDPRQEEGELLWPERFPRETVERLKRELGPIASAGQLQQLPVPKGGNIIEREWWQVWPAEGYEPAQGEPLAYPACNLIIGSVDTAYSEKEENAFNAMTVWGLWEDRRQRPKVILMEGWRQRLSLRGVIPEDAKTDDERRPYWGLVEKVADTIRRRNISIVLIENKTRGADLAAELQRLLNKGECRVILVDPVKDKVTRLHAVQPMFADGMVYAPERAWSELVIGECCTFPKGKYADFVDTTSMALSWLRNNGGLLLGTEADEDNLRSNLFQSRKELPYDV